MSHQRVALYKPHLWEQEKGGFPEQSRGTHMHDTTGSDLEVAPLTPMACVLWHRDLAINFCRCGSSFSSEIVSKRAWWGTDCQRLSSGRHHTDIKPSNCVTHQLQTLKHQCRLVHRLLPVFQCCKNWEEPGYKAPVVDWPLRLRSSYWTMFKCCWHRNILLDNSDSG